MEEESKIFTKEELEILKKRCNKTLENYGNSGPQELWLTMMGNQIDIIPAIAEKMIEEMQKTNQALNTLIEGQERLCKAIEDVIDLELESQEAQTTQRKVEYSYPQTLFDYNAKETEDRRLHDQEVYLV